jgi:ariadne-1
MFGIDECGHKMCIDCYRLYLEEELNKGTPSVYSTCPSDGCLLVVPVEVWKKVMPSKIKRFEQFLFSSYVELTKHVKWCPGQGCDMVIELKDPSNTL